MSILSKYVPRHVRLGVVKTERVKSSPAVSCRISHKDGVIIRTLRSEEMKNFTLDMFRLGAMLEAGVRLDPAPEFYSCSKLDIVSHCAEVASKINDSIDLASSASNHSESEN